MALSAARNTKMMLDQERSPLSWPVKASTKIYEGSFVVISAGYAIPGATATGKVAVGRAQALADNSSGADGDISVSVLEGIFKWANSGTDAVVAADVGATVYIEDDQTVSHTSTGKSAAGKCVQLDSDGVWVKTTL